MKVFLFVSSAVDAIAPKARRQDMNVYGISKGERQMHWHNTQDHNGAQITAIVWILCQQMGHALLLRASPCCCAQIALVGRK
jgi:hypothetical protein